MGELVTGHYWRLLIREDSSDEVMKRFCYCRVALTLWRLSRRRRLFAQAGAGQAADRRRTPPATPPAAPPSPRRRRRCAARAVPGGREDRVLQLQQVVFQAVGRQGRAAARVNALIQKKQTEDDDKAKLLQGNQQKLQTSGSVMNEAARVAAREGNREAAARTASASSRTRRPKCRNCSRKCRTTSSKKLSPIVEELANEKGLHLRVQRAEAGIAWATPGLDLTSEVIKKLDAQAKPGTEQ